MWICRFRLVYILLFTVLFSTLYYLPVYTWGSGSFDGVSIYFMPVDGGEAISRVVELINNAHRYVYVAAYILEEPGIMDALANAVDRGVDVRVVVDSDATSQTVVNWLESRGVKVVVDNRVGDYMHDKFIVVDDEVVVTGSTNFRDRSFYKNNNDLLIIRSRGVALNYKAEFMELYRGVFGGGEPTPNPVVRVDDIVVETYFSPDDGVEKIIEKYIKKANRSIFFAAYVFTNKRLGEILAEKAKSISVVGVFESYVYGDSTSMRYIGELIRRGGGRVYLDVNPYTMHCKLFIIDGEIVITGSYNPTYHAEYSNDENIVVIHSREVAELYLDYYRNYLLPNGTRLIVKVLDTSGEPVGGVEVYAEDLDIHVGVKASTNSSGVAEIVIPGLRPGHRVRVSVATGSLLGVSRPVTVEVGLGPNIVVVRINRGYSRLIVFAVGLIATIVLAFTYPWFKKLLSKK